jgi:hypothetical protein
VNTETATQALAPLAAVHRGPTGLAVALELALVATVAIVVLSVLRRRSDASGSGIQLTVVFAFTAYAAFRLTGFDPALRAGAVVLLAVLGFVVVAALGVEVFWGVAVRLDPAFGLGTQVVLDDVEGRIRRLRARWVEVETSDGWLARIPYRRLHHGVRIRSARHRAALPVRFELEVPSEMDFSAARDRARTLVLCSPWASLDPGPEIEVDDAGRGVLKVEAHTFAREGRSRLVADVRSAWEA